MVKSDAPTVESYLAELPPERREALEAVREVILANLPQGYEECMVFGMIGYVIPLSRYPKTYNNQPLALAALASQKRHMAVYLNNVYGDPETLEWFTSAYEASGKRLDMGKSCVRFTKTREPSARTHRRDHSPHERGRFPLVLRGRAEQGKARLRARPAPRSRNEGERMDMKQVIYDELRRIAKAGVVTYYSDLARLVGLDMSSIVDRNRLSDILGEINIDEDALGRPMLSAVWAVKRGEQAGSGVLEHRGALGSLQRRQGRGRAG